MIKRKVKSCYLHQAITIPGTRISGYNSLVPEKLPSTRMEWDGEQLFIFDGEVEAFIPAANVASGIFAPADKPRADK